MPGWLRADDVTTWATSSGVTGLTVEQVARVIGSVELFVEQCRPDQPAIAEGGYQPDAEVYQGAVMLGARVARRRNSPGGTESFGPDGIVGYVARFDPDIERALRMGSYRQPAVG